MIEGHPVRHVRKIATFILPTLLMLAGCDGAAEANAASAIDTSSPTPICGQAPRPDIITKTLGIFDIPTETGHITSTNPLKTLTGISGCRNVRIYPALDEMLPADAPYPFKVEFGSE